MDSSTCSCPLNSMHLCQSCKYTKRRGTKAFASLQMDLRGAEGCVQQANPLHLFPPSLQTSLTRRPFTGCQTRNKFPWFQEENTLIPAWVGCPHPGRFLTLAGVNQHSCSWSGGGLHHWRCRWRVLCCCREALHFHGSSASERHGGAQEEEG